MSAFTDKARAVIAAVAPTVGTALGGPFGALAGVVVAKALGKEGQAAPEAAVSDAIASGDPSVYVQLKQAENDFTARMTELGLKPEQLANEDRASARAREVAVKDHVPAVLAVIVTVGFFGTLAFLLIHGKPEAGGDALLVMLGALGGAWASIIAYYFGSSAGSKDKTAALATIAKMP